MSKYTYIVNVDNAVDVSHFRMYFHESISRRKLSLYSIDDLRELPGRIDHITRHIDRNVFRSDENELIICVSRVWTAVTDINWWTLMIRAKVYTACSPVIRRKVSKVRLIIVDNENGALPEEKVYRLEADRMLQREGFVRETDPAHRCIDEKWLKTLAASYLEADDAGKQQILGSIGTAIPDNSLMSDFIRDVLVSYGSNAEVHSLTEVYASYFERILLDKLRNIDTCVIPVTGSDNAERRMTQLKLVTFLIDMTGRKLSDRATVAEEFDIFEFDPSIEAVRLKRYADKISTESQRLKKAREKARSEVKVAFSSMHRIEPLSEERLIGNQDDVEYILNKVTGFRNSDSWEDEFDELIKEIASYEGRLEAYGKTVNEEFHEKKQPDNLVPDVITYENEKEAMKFAEKEFMEANENAYRERGKGDSTYSALVDITNQLQIVGNCLKKLNRAKMSRGNSGFLRLLLFGAAIIIIPYSIMQTYIYQGIINGNVLPLVCMLILFIAFLVAKPVADASLDSSFRREVRKLSGLVEKFFEGIQQRQTLFHDNVDCMAAIWNAERKLEACREVVNSKAENNRRVDYHRDALEEYDGIMSYFTSFIDNYYNDDNNKRIDDPVTQVDPKKDITDNGVYWIGNIVDIV